MLIFYILSPWLLLIFYMACFNFAVSFQFLLLAYSRL